jgi:CheY-like chemotaxis protein
LTGTGSNKPVSTGFVVLVEDDAIVRMISAELLRDLHYEVAEAASGEEAMTVLESAAADVLITDLNLPGMSGDDLARAARRVSPHIRVIFASGDVSKAPRDPSNPAYILRKPYDVRDLAKAMAAVKPS